MIDPDWRLQPLRNFWQNVNWENRAVVPALSQNNGKAAPALSYLMTVREYFRAISWTGILEIGSTAIDTNLSNSAVVEESSETLEDFLDDISKFF
ncbi:MAG: hypothetical protein DCF19_21005 [Pseudanabaena frigida]|uniref:Uncharacterized protein n=1 Tax=Pseudanabaena frigida TaxID=945775 RepID=A0A2W4VWD2_9CYAN|nr:MAG: hypothetical protein DCF19_21005 [Pseudanabaena frigida]